MKHHPWLVDTHGHLNLGQYDNDYPDVINESLKHNVGIIMPGCDLESSKKAVEIAKQYTGQPIWAAVGQHPTDSAEHWDDDAYHVLAQSDRVVAIGEIGLDYFHLPGDTAKWDAIKAEQKVLLQKQLDLAREVDKPVIIHCRDAHDDLIELLAQRYGVWTGDRERGVIHCFTATSREARSYLDLGFLISFTGIITFTDQYNEIVSQTPLEKMMIETDSPFLTPTPYRGKRNHPQYVWHVAERMAQIKDVSFDQVALQTSKNAQRLFHIQIP